MVLPAEDPRIRSVSSSVISAAGFQLL